MEELNAKEIKLFSVVKQLLTKVDNFFPIEIRYDDKGEMYLTIHIGSKTGTGELRYDEEKKQFTLQTRYSTIDTFEEEDWQEVWEQLADIAWGWFVSYQSRDYGPSGYWYKIWEDQGKIKSETRTETTYKIL